MKDTIEKIRFQKYKSFPESVKHEIDVQKPICLIIGRNSSGKSSVVDIFELVFNSIRREQAELTFIQSINIELGLTLTENHLVYFNSKFILVLYIIRVNMQRILLAVLFGLDSMGMIICCLAT